jgi:ABC-type uncharacterized transport system ATPase subunit
MYAVIDVADLHKQFGHVRALDGPDLQVAEGEIHGFLGANHPDPARSAAGHVGTRTVVRS